MNFQTKIIIFILGLILFSIAILTIICSTYFFYALTRKGLSKMKKKILTFKNIPSAESFKPFIDHNWFKNHNASQLHITSYDNLKLQLQQCYVILLHIVIIKVLIYFQWIIDVTEKVKENT